MPRKFAITLLLAGASACVSSGYERASATADKTAAYRDNLVRLGEEIGLTTEALRALSDNPGDSPRSNQETFETFERELTNLEDGAARSRKTFGKMDGRADTFFGGWSEDSAEITDADLKKSSESRRAALKANYDRLEEGQRAADEALARYVHTLTDLRRYLENDLTAAGIASASASIQRAFPDGAALRKQLEEQVRATDGAREAIEPLQDLAPSQQVRTSGRVR